jgi:hypothetical protein
MQEKCSAAAQPTLSFPELKMREDEGGRIHEQLHSWNFDFLSKFFRISECKVIGEIIGQKFSLLTDNGFLIVGTSHLIKQPL